MTRENTSWVYDRIQGALTNLGLIIAPNTSKKILIWHGMEPVPQRKCTTTWSGFIRAHLSILAGADYITVELLTLRWSVTYYVLFFIPLESCKIVVSGLAPHPNVR